MKPRRTRRALEATAILGALASTCTQSELAPERVWIVVSPGDSPLSDVQNASVRPKDAVLILEQVESHLVVALDRSKIHQAVHIEPQNACPISVPAAAFDRDPVQRVAAEPWLSFGRPLAQLGYDAPFEVEVRPGCEYANRGRIDWVVSDGQLQALTIADHGFKLTGRTVSIDEALPNPPPWGVVPISPRERGHATLTATWRDTERALRFTIAVDAAARGRGLPNVAVSEQVLLAGNGWTIVEPPPDALGQLESHGKLSTFAAQSAGTWTLEDAAGARLKIHAGRYDATPLDCGRSDCHREIAEATAHSPMTKSFYSLLQQGAAGSTDMACAVGCHTTGDPGLSDGGFAHVTAELGKRLLFEPSAQGWAALATEQRRLGGVGCLACHGPGAVPEADARWAILRSGVCAYCHDAPPRYGHVAAWKTTQMSHAARSSAARTQPECIRCHTTDGFLQSQGDRGEPRATLKSDLVEGIECAACHAVHVSGSTAPARALLRSVDLPDALAAYAQPNEMPSTVCLPCHSVDRDERWPRATSAEIWAGRGGLEPSTGEPLVGPAPHASIARGCIGCHHRGPAQLRRGAAHAFRASPTDCQPCHEQRSAAREQFAELANDLLQRLLPRAHARLSIYPASPHAVIHSEGPVDTPLERAVFNVLLVMGDGAAAIHNPRYARMLLDSAARALEEAERH